MRLLLAMSLFTLALAVPSARAEKNQATPPPKDRFGEVQIEEREFGWALNNSKIWRHQAVGYGITHADAEQMAHREAYDAVVEFLKRRLPELTWVPSPEYLRRLGVIPSGGEVVPSVNVQGVGPTQRVTLTLQISPSAIDDILRQDRMYRTRDRHWAWSKMLGGLVGLLIIVGGYYRLEEMTKGYYTTRLRVVAIGSSIVVGVVVLLLMVG